MVEFLDCSWGGPWQGLVKCGIHTTFLVLDASQEVGHEEIRLIALYLAVLYWLLPKQGDEGHSQQGAGPLLISRGLLAYP